MSGTSQRGRLQTHSSVSLASNRTDEDATPPTSSRISTDAIAEQVHLPDNSLLVASDASFTWGTKLIGFLFLVAAVLCLYLAAEQLSGSVGGQIACYAIAILLGAIALVISLQLHSPTSLHLCQINGVWSVMLKRKTGAPVVRPLDDVLAYVETFGYCSRIRMRFWGKRVGYTTSAAGTVYLFFGESDSGPEIAMCASLQEPFAFFCGLRDVMNATSHLLAQIVTDYILDWEESEHPDIVEEEEASDISLQNSNSGR